MIPGLDSMLGGGGLAMGSASSGKFGPISGAPVVVNVAGFGSRASGSATSSAQEGEVPSADLTPAGMPSWLLPAVAAAVVLALALVLKKRRA